MNVTRVIASAVFFGAVALSAAYAQTSRPASPPAEFPPAAYQGKQYVDSRGCVYVRAEIDGAVAWVPRVTPQRNHVCGQQPTHVAVATGAPAGSSAAPAGAGSAAAAASAPRRVAAPAGMQASGRVPARYVAWNYENGQKQNVGVLLNENTRVLPRHIHDRRVLARDVRIPRGYQRVWRDDRLNPRRAERSLRPPVYTNQVRVPPGYQLVDREDDRLNTRRGPRSADGDAGMARIWDDEVPRRLRLVPTQGQVITAPEVPAYIDAAEAPALVRLSTRSAPDQVEDARPDKGRYVRVGRFRTDAQARSAADGLTASGIPARPGLARRGDESYSVVLVGPFATNREARAALRQVRQAGYSKARLSR